MKPQTENYRLIALAISSFFPLMSVADNVSSCDTFLTLANYNLTQSGNEADAKLLLKSSFCSANYLTVDKTSIEAAEIEAAYESVSGSSSSISSDAQTKFCTNGIDRNNYRTKVTSSFSTNLYDDAVQSWKDCRKNSLSSGVNFELKPNHRMQSVDVDLFTLSGTPATLKGIRQTGVGHSTCKTTIPARNGSITGKQITLDTATTLKFDAANKLLVTCERQMLSDKNGNLSADAQNLKFDTSAGTYNIDLAETGSLSRVSVAQMKADIQTVIGVDTSKQIEQVKTDNQTAINQAITAPTNSINSLVNSVNTLNSQISTLNSGVIMGGFYEVDIFGNVLTVNSLTGTTNCPSGFSPMTMAQVHSFANNSNTTCCPAMVTACYKKP